MSQIEKLKARFYRKPIPNDITFDEVFRLAEYYGCKIISGGNHPVKIVDIPSGTVIPIPQHGNCIKEAYIKELKILFDEIESRKNGGI